MEMNVDVVVVGSAASGLACAIQAKENGIGSVLVLEKMGVPGGCSRFAGGIMGFDSPVQKRMGYYYSADQAFKDLIRNLNWYVDAKLVRKWLLRSGEDIQWLQDMGVKFEEARAWNDRPDVNRHSYHVITPKAPGQFVGYLIVEAMKTRCRELGIDIMCRTRATSLIQDRSGRVTGVKAETADGGELIVHADNVMLATGSMGANREMMREYFKTDEFDDIAIMSSFPFLTGDGHGMATAAGAAKGKMSIVPIGPHNHFKGASEVVGAVARRPNTIKINTNGERFVDESLCSESEFGWFLSAAVDYQPNKMSYTLLDASILQHMTDKRDEEIFLVDFGATEGKHPRRGRGVCGMPCFAAAGDR